MVLLGDADSKVVSSQQILIIPFFEHNYLLLQFKKYFGSLYPYICT